jgi:DNA adenine methylase
MKITTEQINMNSNLKPPLKWAGGKRWLVPHLRPIWAAHSERRLVEPFCGGLSVALGFMPGCALLNDLNRHLINYYQQIKQGLLITIPMANHKDLYYDYREQFNRLLKEEKDQSKEAAELFYYLNRTGYNGLCRFNKKGFFNVPFGSYKIINYLSDHSVYREAFSDWNFLSTDFEALPVNKDDFIYADPPYDVQFTQYSSKIFTWDDQVRLAQWLVKHKGPVVLSNQATERVIDLYCSLGFNLHFFDAPRRISCNGNRTPAKELLATRGL